MDLSDTDVNMLSELFGGGPDAGGRPPRPLLYNVPSPHPQYIPAFPLPKKEPTTEALYYPRTDETTPKPTYSSLSNQVPEVLTPSTYSGHVPEIGTTASSSFNTPETPSYSYSKPPLASEFPYSAPNNVPLGPSGYRGEIKLPSLAFNRSVATCGPPSGGTPQSFSPPMVPPKIPTTVLRPTAKPPRTCRYMDCMKTIQKHGLCHKHGGKRYCRVEGCFRKDRGSGHCVAHGGGKRCEIEDCNRVVRKGIWCAIHTRQNAKLAQTSGIKSSNPTGLSSKKWSS